MGRLTARKGQDRTLQAMPEILREFPDAIYLIGGTGAYEGELGKLAASLGVEDHVRFLGNVPQELLPDLYNLADIFVMPNRESAVQSNVEGFGIVFLEANACGKPVIGGRSGGVPDAVLDGRTGLLVDGDSPEEIAAAATRFLGDPGMCRRLGEAGRDRVRRELTWDISARRIREAVEQTTRCFRLKQR
jgi:phosphatidylinositol alpha-1,6-mannosyltransferase